MYVFLKKKRKKYGYRIGIDKSILERELWAVKGSVGGKVGHGIVYLESHISQFLTRHLIFSAKKA